MPVDDYQLLWRRGAGLLMGPGTSYTPLTALGLEGFAVRDSDTEVARADGTIPGIDLLSRVLVDLTFRVDGTTSAVGALVGAFEQAFRRSRTDEYALEWKVPGQPAKVVWCRPLQLERDVNQRTLRSARLGVQLKASGPFRYGAERRGIPLAPYSAASPGIDYPIVNFPKDWPAATGTSDVVATNGGNDDAYPVLVVTKATGSAGQVTQIELVNVTTGATSVYAGTIDPGQTLTIDYAALVPLGVPREPVLLSGASRYGNLALPRDPWTLPAGDSLVRLLVSGNTAGVTAGLSWDDTYSS